MDKCDNISSLSFSNFPLKTSFAIKSFQKSLETHLRIITPLTSSIGTIIHGDLNGTIIPYKKKSSRVARNGRFWRSLLIYSSNQRLKKKNRDKFMEKYIHFGLLCVLICAFTKNINFIPFKRNWQVFFACASICFKHHYHWQSNSLTYVFPSSVTFAAC